MSAELIAQIAAMVGKLISAVATMIGEPEDIVRARVLEQLKKDAADPSDETDKVAAEIDADLPD
jgi:hypothetical protein